MGNYNDTFPDMNCRSCDVKVKPMTTGETNETHGYKLFCPDCKTFVGWGGKKKDLMGENGMRQKSSQWSASRLGADCCEICRRTKKMIGPGNLEVHHKIPVSKGGPDVPENILVVCTACHKQVHFLQIYMNHHLSGYYGGAGNERAT